MPMASVRLLLARWHRAAKREEPSALADWREQLRRALNEALAGGAGTVVQGGGRNDGDEIASLPPLLALLGPGRDGTGCVFAYDQSIVVWCWVD